MPSRSPKQKKLMAAVAHGWKPDRIDGPPKDVAVEFNEADAAKGAEKNAKRASKSMVPGAVKKYSDRHS